MARDLLQRAFRDTYGLQLTDLFDDFDLAINPYRSAVSRTIPTATRVAWSLRKDEIRKIQPGASRKAFVYIIKRSSYRRDWGQRYDPPGKWDRFIAFLLRLLPAIGPLRALGFKMPTPPVEQIFMRSFERCVQGYAEKLDEVRNNALVLGDPNYDVGLPTPAGVYRLNAETQAFWLHELAEKKFASVKPAIKQALLRFYGVQGDALEAPRRQPQLAQNTLTELEQLQRWVQR